MTNFVEHNSGTITGTTLLLASGYSAVQSKAFNAMAEAWKYSGDNLFVTMRNDPSQLQRGKQPLKLQQFYSFFLNHWTPYWQALNDENQKTLKALYAAQAQGDYSGKQHTNYITAAKGIAKQYSRNFKIAAIALGTLAFASFVFWPKATSEQSK